MLNTLKFLANQKNHKNTMTKTIALLITFFLAFQVIAQDLKSPDNNFSIDFTVNEQGIASYSLSYKNQLIINPSNLGIDLMNQTNLIENFTIIDQESSSFDVPE